MDGLIYLLNQSGMALMQANARIAELEQQITTLSSEKSPTAKEE